MRIGYIQNDPLFGEKEKNFKGIRTLVRDVHADLLVLPELFATGYAFTSRDEALAMAETDRGPTFLFLKELSGSTGATMVGGFIERENDRIYNSLLIVSGDRVIGSYRKIHLFYKEHFWFAPGDRMPAVYEINGVRIGVMICFDWIFPEVCRALALKGMQVLAHPANLVMLHCQNAMVTRCLENGIFAVTANRTGSEQRGEDHFVFTGSSQVTGNDGRILSSAPADVPQVSVVEIDEKRADHKLITPYNDVLKDRRPGLYDISR
jgi:predicted amidohydrolase